MKTLTINGIKPEHLDKLKDFLAEVFKNGQFAEYLAVNGVQIAQAEIEQITINPEPVNLAESLADKAINEGGFTVNLFGAEPNKQDYKYFVSKRGHEYPILLDSPDLVNEIADYIKRKRALLTKENIFIGGWAEGDTLYLDISEGFNPRYKPEFIKELAQARKQKAYYNYWESKTVYV